MKYPLLLAACLMLAPALSAESAADRAKAEVIAADTAFADKASKDGILQAFLAYCTDSTKFLGSRILRGPTAAKALFGDVPKDAILTWKPDFAESSEAGDLAYTCGRYQYSQPIPGKPAATSAGTYVTIWRRQADGTWKFVLDGGTTDPKPRG